MEFRWSREKDKRLQAERDISFSDLVEADEKGCIIAVEPHPIRAKQIVFIFLKDGYVYVAPCVEEGDGVYFVKTIYPSRKAKKKYLSVLSK
jgi:hypothetical protein